MSMRQTSVAVRDDGKMGFSQCGNCGATNIEGSKFCSNCGVAFASNVGDVPPGSKPIREGRTTTISPIRRRNIIILSVLALIAIVAIAAIILIVTEKTNQVRITVQSSSGTWVGAYGTVGNINTWTGSGTESVVLDRPANTQNWVVVADAMSSGLSGEFTITITTMDGKVLATQTSGGWMVTVTVTL